MSEGRAGLKAVVHRGDAGSQISALRGPLESRFTEAAFV